MTKRSIFKYNARCSGPEVWMLSVMAKVLSLLQPWASLVAMGIKTIETRSWGTAYRGPLLIHAGLRRSGKAAWRGSAVLQEHIAAFDELPFGRIVGEVRLTGVQRLGSLDLSPEEFRRRSLEERVFGEAPARFAWLFSDALLLDEPLAATGRLGLWEI